MAASCTPTSTTSTSRSPRSSVWSAWPCSRSWWSRSHPCCGARAHRPRNRRHLGGVVAAAAAFAVHSGFDFVWHLPAIVLTVTLLVGLVLPAPDTAPAQLPSIPVLEEEPDENQAAH